MPIRGTLPDGSGAAVAVDVGLAGFEAEALVQAVGGLAAGARRQVHRAGAVLGRHVERVAVEGRLLCSDGAITLLSNTVTLPTP